MNIQIIQPGGSALNGLVNERPAIRKAVMGIILGSFKEPKQLAIQTHTKMLVALADMTTYSLINQVIDCGGAIIALNPLVQQCIRYTEERQEVFAHLNKLDLTEDEVCYIHIRDPFYQYFKAADYSDMIRV